MELLREVAEVRVRNKCPHSIQAFYNFRHMEFAFTSTRTRLKNVRRVSYLAPRKHLFCIAFLAHLISLVEYYDFLIIIYV